MKANPQGTAPDMRFSQESPKRVSDNPTRWKEKPWLPIVLAIMFVFLASSCSSTAGPHSDKLANSLERIMGGGESSTSWDAVELAGGAVRGKTGVVYYPASFALLPGWNNGHMAGALASFKEGCRVKSRDPMWSNLCSRAASLPINEGTARDFFMANFRPWSVTNGGKNTGLMTGYYEPGINGSMFYRPSSRFPIYGVPRDLVTLNTGGRSGQVRFDMRGPNKASVSPNGRFTANINDFPDRKGSQVKGRIVGSRLVPYHSRMEINSGALANKAPIIAYADDPIELFFLQIQGSGKVITPEGQSVHLQYADNNGRPFVSIGTYMAKQGYMNLNQTSMQGIKEWMTRNPGKLAEVLAQNPRYIFFKSRTDVGTSTGPIGALGVPLTAEHSGAVDKRYIPLGTPVYISATDPRNNGPFQRLIMAQDTGSAIKGPIRVDFFWGFGQMAGEAAGRTKSKLNVWILLPKGVSPR